MSDHVCAGSCAKLPNGERPASEPACRCGAPWQLEADRGGVWRCKGGHPKPGTPGPRLEHGGRSVEVRLALIDARRAALAESRQAIFADLGGAENVGRLKADLVERYLETSLIAQWLGGNLLVDGVLTTKGRARAAASFYLQVLDRISRLTAALGLERRAKAVPSPLDYIEGRDE
jgi:hypothetical protein